MEPDVAVLARSCCVSAMAVVAEAASVLQDLPLEEVGAKSSRRCQIVVLYLEMRTYGR